MIWWNSSFCPLRLDVTRKRWGFQRRRWSLVVEWRSWKVERDGRGLSLCFFERVLCWTFHNSDCELTTVCPSNWRNFKIEWQVPMNVLDRLDYITFFFFLNESILLQSRSCSGWMVHVISSLMETSCQQQNRVALTTLAASILLYTHTTQQP